MRRDDVFPIVAALGITGLLGWGLVYFVNHWWGRLPKACLLYTSRCV